LHSRTHFDQSSRYSANNREWRDFLGNDRASRHYGSIPDGDAIKDHRVGPNPDTIADPNTP
jgi:hypothetical protein